MVPIERGTENHRMFATLIKPPQGVTAPATPTSARSTAVDFLRGIAILLVLGCHFTVAPAAAGFLEPVAGAWYRIGWAGVDLFFVLSGFLVSGLLFAEFKRNGRVDAPRFLVRRGFKIWPSYFAYLAFVAIWLIWQQGRGDASARWTSLWPNLLHVQNYFGTPRVHTWSLAVEEHFYLIGAGLAALLLVRSRFDAVRRVFPIVVVASLQGVAWVRYDGFASAGRDGINLFATHLRFDGLLIGSLVAYFAHFAPERLQWTRRYPLASMVAGLALAAPVLVLTPDHGPLTAGPGLTVMYAGFALAMLGVLGLEQGRQWERQMLAAAPVRGIARVGFFSYGIYLWHLDLARVPLHKAGELLAQTGLPGELLWVGVTTAYVALAVIMGALMSRAIEIPFLALRERLFPGRAGAKPAATEAPAGAGPAVVAPVASGAVVPGS